MPTRLATTRRYLIGTATRETREAPGGSVTAVTDLAPLTMPAADAGTDAWSAWLTTRTSDQLDRVRDLVAAIKADRPRRAADLLDRWNEITVALGNAFAASGLLQ